MYGRPARHLRHLVSAFLYTSILAANFFAGRTEVAADPIIVRSVDELRSAVRAAAPNQIIRIAEGQYGHGWSVSGVDDLTIEALDPKQPPEFAGGNLGWHFSRCNRLTVRHLIVRGQKGNGLNLDDGGKINSPIKGITIDAVTVEDIGPRGNVDAIKCSGLDDLTIRNCRISGWGGQGIDMVGCHHSRIEDCHFTGKDGYSASAAVQMKGGSSDIVVEGCRFQNAGERPLNVGGSTGAAFFRPTDARSEASRITVRKNTIEGSPCAAAFVGVDGAEFSGNTILFPQKWIFRILQETTTPGFAPCRNVVIADNQIIFRRGQVQTDINVGGNTEPETFQFRGNQWFAEDRPAASRPRISSSEVDGVYGIDPRK